MAISWNVPIIAVAAAVVGFWLLAECAHFLEDRRRMRQRFSRPVV
jgi:hypothetical protein